MSDNTIYILGAGASRAVTTDSKLPSPLATDFFKEKYIKANWLGKFPSSDYSNTKLYKLVSRYFGKKDDINIEEVYSFLDFISNSFYSTYSEKLDIQTAKHELLEYLFHILYYGVEYSSNHYDKIVENLKIGDSIITFNWDLMIDQLLINSEQGKIIHDSLNEIINPTNSFGNNDYDTLAYNNLHKGYFLKMHGSINWAICGNNECHRHSIPFIFNLDKEIYLPMWNCNYCGCKLEMLLMPPHVHKNFRANRIFNLQAKIAYEKIYTAKEIIIIGYSFPEFDFEVNSLFRKAKLTHDDDGSELFLNTIHLVDPAVNSKKFVEKIENIFGVKRSNETYGHEIKLKTYESLDIFIKSYFT